MAQKIKILVVNNEPNIIDPINLTKVTLSLLMFQFDIFEETENTKLISSELKLEPTEMKVKSTQRKI
jgi:hypothetical protein